MTSFRVGATTHVGQVRQNNQDSILAFTEQGIFAVADGMGGHRGGEVASAVAIATLEESFTEPSIDALVDAVQMANEAVVTKAENDPDLRGMGTTLCVLGRITTPDEFLAIANVGDSRLYLLRAEPRPDGDPEPRPDGDPEGDPDGDLLDDLFDDDLFDDDLFDDDPDPTPPPSGAIDSPDFEQITEDHSLVATLVRQGQITKEEAEVHPHKNILTRALGIDARVMVDSWVLVPVAGDRYLICSDGLFNEVTEAQIAATLRAESSPQDAADVLVDMANAGGGRDNISVVIVEIADDEGRMEGFDESGSRVVRVLHGSQLEENDREIAEAVAGTSVAGASHAPAAPQPDPAATQPDPGAMAPPRPAADPSVVPTEIGADTIRPPPTLPGGHVTAPPAAQVVAAGTSHITWRVGIFAVAFIAVAAAVAAAFLYSANNTYFVGLQGDNVAIFQGRPGGVLWMKPTVVESSDLSGSNVPPQFQADILRGRDEPDVIQARQYIQNIREEMQRLGTPATTTPTTTTPATTRSTTPASDQPTVGGSIFSSGSIAPVTPTTA